MPKITPPTADHARVKFPVGGLAVVERAAEDAGLTISDLIRRAVARYLKRPDLAKMPKPGRRWPEKP